MRLQINECVKVKLTERGKELYAKRYGEPEADHDGYTRFQIHYLMHFFGPYVGLGEDPVFENGNIIIGDF